MSTFQKKLTRIILLADSLLYFLLPLKVYQYESAYVIYPIWWLSVFAIIIIGRWGGTFIEILVFVFIFLMVSFFFTFLNFFFCGWNDHGILYINKTNHSLRIRCKTFDCYGTSENCRFFKERILLKNIYWVTEFNKNKIDTTVWQEVPFNTQ
jgi:hypothetical protein